MMKTNHKLQWEDCNDNNFWSDKDNEITLVSYNLGEKSIVNTKDECPYGWNILTKLGAKCLTIKLP